MTIVARNRNHLSLSESPDKFAVSTLKLNLEWASSSCGFLLLILKLPPLEIYMIREAGEDHNNASPLLSRQRIATYDRRHNNAYKLSRGRDSCVCKGSKSANGEEDEVLSNGPTNTVDKYVYSCFWMVPAKLYCFVTTALG